MEERGQGFRRCDKWMRLSAEPANEKGLKFPPWRRIKAIIGRLSFCDNYGSIEEFEKAALTGIVARFLRRPFRLARWSHLSSSEFRSEPVEKDFSVENPCDVCREGFYPQIPIWGESRGNPAETAGCPVYATTPTMNLDRVIIS